MTGSYSSHVWSFSEAWRGHKLPLQALEHPLEGFKKHLIKPSHVASVVLRKARSYDRKKYPVISWSSGKALSVALVHWGKDALSWPEPAVCCLYHYNMGILFPRRGFWMPQDWEKWRCCNATEFENQPCFLPFPINISEWLETVRREVPEDIGCFAVISTIAQKAICAHSSGICSGLQGLLA